MTNEEYRLKQYAAMVQQSIDNGLMSVLFGEKQNLTEGQKEQARINIGAVSEAYVTAAINTALGNYPAALAGLDEVIGGEQG